MALKGTVLSSCIKIGANGRQTIAPTAQQVQVTCNAVTRLSTGFSATTPMADASAATRQRMTPARGAWCDVVAKPITTTPANASAPGENARPAARMPTNADAHRTTETSAAPSGSQLLRGDAGAGVVGPSFFQIN